MTRLGISEPGTAGLRGPPNFKGLTAGVTLLVELVGVEGAAGDGLFGVVVPAGAPEATCVLPLFPAAVGPDEVWVLSLGRCLRGGNFRLRRCCVRGLRCWTLSRSSGLSKGSVGRHCCCFLLFSFDFFFLSCLDVFAENDELFAAESQQCEKTEWQWNEVIDEDRL
jgi:hypothetical protein